MTEQDRPSVSYVHDNELSFVDVKSQMQGDQKISVWLKKTGSRPARRRLLLMLQKSSSRLKGLRGCPCRKKNNTIYRKKKKKDERRNRKPGRVSVWVPTGRESAWSPLGA